jgi:hypothetical protein
MNAMDQARQDENVREMLNELAPADREILTLRYALDYDAGAINTGPATLPPCSGPPGWASCWCSWGGGCVEPPDAARGHWRALGR